MSSSDTVKRRANPPRRRRNQASNVRVAQPRSVLLTAVQPRPECALHTREHGTLMISADSNLSPDIETLAFLVPNQGEWEQESVFSSMETSVDLKERLQQVLQAEPLSEPHTLQTFIKQSDHIFHEFISHKIQQQHEQKDKSTTSITTWTVDYVEELTNQLEELERVYEKDVIKSLSSDLFKLELQYKDEGERMHSLGVELSPRTFPQACPTCQTELPVEWQPSWRVAQKKRKTSHGEMSDESGLVGLFDDFTSVVDSCQSLWNELDDLDGTTWVLEPASPNRSIVERRIAVTEAISVVLELATDQPRNPPTTVRWIGADTARLRRKLEKYVRSKDKSHCWSNRISVKENLERGLGVSLPKPRSEVSDDETGMECSICYNYHLQDEGKVELPDSKCDNLSCGRIYHEYCLRNWLVPLPSSRKSFDRILGSCPYCSEPISAPMQ